MKQTRKNTLRSMAKCLGLQLRYVSYLGDDTHGKLLVSERRILLNANKPRVEHTYTVLHELGHFLLHARKLHRRYQPRFLDTLGKVEFLAKACSTMRRYLRFRSNKESARERDADLWGMCAFRVLARRVGFREELIAFLNRHPEKTGLFLLATVGDCYDGARSRIRRITRTLSSPFGTS